MPSFLVITTIAVIGTTDDVAKVYTEVCGFHRTLAEKYSVVVSPKLWKVNVSKASLRAEPAATALRIGYALMGDVLIQTEELPEWIRTDKEWIMKKQVEEVIS